MSDRETEVAEVPPEMLHPPSASRWRGWFAIGVPVIVALALMIPRVARAHFGLLDDPASLTVADRIAAGEWGLGSDVTFGRFRPVYWYYFAVLDRVASGSPQLHFVGNALLLAATTGLLACLARRATRSNLVGTTTGLLFVLGGPVVESAFTLSKPELLQSLLIVAWMWVAGLVRRPKTTLNLVALGLGVVFALLAAMTKETGVLLFPVSALLLLRSMVLRAPDAAVQAREYAARVGALVTAGLAAASALILAVMATRDLFSAAGPQTGFELSNLLAGVRVWADWLARDYLYIVPLGLAWLVVAAWRSHTAGGFRLLVDCAIWVLLWLVPHLTYRFTPEYYLLPLSLGVSLAAGVLLWDVLTAQTRQTLARRALAILLIASSGMLVLLTLPTNASNAAIQLVVDEANSEMVDLVAAVLPDRATLLVNFEESYEYVHQLGPMLQQVKDRGDIAVAGSASPFPPAVIKKPNLYVVSPILENQPYPTVRLGVDERSARVWEQGLRDELGPRVELIGEVRSSATMRMVDSPRLLCLLLPRVDYCQVPHTPIDTRRFAAGWRLYAVEPLDP